MTFQSMGASWTRAEPYPAAYFRGRPLDLLRCSLAQASTSGGSHNLGRPGPRSITGRGMSGYRRKYVLTLFG